MDVALAVALHVHTFINVKTTSPSTRKLAVVTGASSGIGFELAKQFAKNHYDVLIASHGEKIVEAGEDLQEFANDYDVTIEVARVDLSTREGVEDLHEIIQFHASKGQPLDAIAINAGMGVGGASFDKTDLEDELKLINLNIVSAVTLAKLVLPAMIKRGEGRILFTSSVAAAAPGPYESVYAASKSFIQSFSQALHQEMKPKGITVTALMPGPTDTGIFKQAGMEETKVNAGDKDDPAEVAEQGFHALMNGDTYVIGGSWKNKIIVGLAKLAPEALAAKAHAQMTMPNSLSDR